MIEGLGWLTLIVAGVAAVIAAFVHPRPQSAANTPVLPPDPEPTQAVRDAIKNAASDDIGAIEDDVAGDDPAGDIADASDSARSDR